MNGVILSVVGARPNFMKMAPVARALDPAEHTRHVVVHTGQHYDAAMSDAFFRDLDIPPPDFNLEVGSGSHSGQTATAMQRLEPVLQEVQPDLVLVYGDVNSTLAATLVAVKLGIPVGHVEAGLRSRDVSMPEEINRVLTDRVARLLFAPSRDAIDNLLLEGIPPERIFLVGNVMIDSLIRSMPRALQVDLEARYGVCRGRYAMVTLHRPANVDDPETLRELRAALHDVSCELPVLFPVHPRTRQRLGMCDADPIESGVDNLRLLDPLPYLDMLALVMSAGVVITDSGGLQEETTYLGISCLTVRPNTERPITCLAGTNRLVPARRDAILAAVREARARTPRGPARIPGWDGQAAERIASLVLGDAEPPQSPYDLVHAPTHTWKAAGALSVGV